MTWTTIAPYVKGFVGAIVGALVVGLCWTASVDHARTTAMWNFLQAQAAQAPAGKK